jgi:hypothetical protein
VATIPAVAASRIWSIGLYAGASPLELQPAKGISNPVITASTVSDVNAEFVADPFMLRIQSLWYMFFEVLNAANKRGEIGYAVSSDGLHWRYQHIVLREPFHLSYPYVFQWNEGIYMIPETLKANAIRIYRANSYPERWEFLADVIPGAHADPSIFCFQNRWWLFASPVPHHQDTLLLYSAETPMGPWKAHPCNPIIAGNKQIARPGGRVLPWENGLIRFTQDCYPTYGRQVRAFQIEELTLAVYREREVAQSPVLVPGEFAWNAAGMHHVDAHDLKSEGWLACVDGLL